MLEILVWHLERNFLEMGRKQMSYAPRTKRSLVTSFDLRIEFGGIARVQHVCFGKFRIWRAQFL